MYFRMMYDEELAQASYLIGCQATGEAIVIDPLRDIEQYIEAAKKEDLRIIAAAETHIHADFVSGARELAERVNATVYVSGEGGEAWQSRWVHEKTTGGAYPHKVLHDGDTFDIGRIRFIAEHTPGHTPEHMCYLVIDAGGGATEPIGVLTGDFVFVGDLGRPDLLEKAAGIAGTMRIGLNQLRRSTEWFGLLPHYAQVWPGHGAGSPCGKELGAIPQSTVGYELRHNDSLRAAPDEAAFERAILEAQPEPPPYFARMKQINRDGPAVLGSLPSPRRISWADAAARPRSIVDIRPWESFRDGHIPGSINLPLHRTFTIAAGSYLDPHASVTLLADNERDAHEAIRRLVRVGIDRVEGLLLHADLPATGLQTCREIPARELAASPTGKIVLDVRRANEYVQGHINGALNISHVQVATRIAEVPRTGPVYVICRTGKRSARATAVLKSHGIDAINIAGGMTAYLEAGGPTVR